jgi:hypothetical protein
MADQLVVDHYAGGIRIVWSLDDGDDIGAILGERHGEKLPSQPPKDDADAECWYADQEARKIFKDAGGESMFKDSAGYFWETEKQAEAALKRIQTTIDLGMARRRGEKPLPEWAQEALKQGWKPPKGWKP